MDYLLGRSDKKALLDYNIISSLPMRLKELAKERKKSLHKIATEIEVDETLLYRWARAEVLPNLYNLTTLADYLGCSVDYLIGRNE